MLTDAKVRNARAAEKPYKLADSHGLHLHVSTTGHRSWRWRYQKGGRETLVVLGEYPAVSLREAREDRDRRRHELRHGAAAPAAKPSPTLSEIVHRWHATNAPRWKPHHAADVLAGLEAEILSALGTRPVREVTPPEVLAALRLVQNRSVDIAHRIRGRLSDAFAFAIGEGLAETNPAEAIRAAMAPLIRTGHRPAVTTLEAARETLQRAEAIPAFPVTRLALRFLALTATRPGEVGGARWVEFGGAVWTIPAARMKAGREHIVPLARQALEVLEAVRTLSGRGPFAFPSATSIQAAMSNNALNVMLRRAGLQGVQVPHGWRATFSTVMNERFPADRLVIDLMLAHAEARGAVEAAYNRATHMERRRELAQVWADLLLEGASPAAALLGLSRRG